MALPGLTTYYEYPTNHFFYVPASKEPPIECECTSFLAGKTPTNTDLYRRIVRVKDRAFQVYISSDEKAEWSPLYADKNCTYHTGVYIPDRWQSTKEPPHQRNESTASTDSIGVPLNINWTKTAPLA